MASSSSGSSSISGGDITVVLTPLMQKNYELESRKGFRIRVEVTSASGIDEEIFRYYQKPAEPITGEVKSVFSGVCSWPDLEDLPIGAPTSESIPQAFRLSYFDIVVDSVAVAQDVWEVVQEEVQVLVNAVHNGKTLEEGNPVTIVPE